MQQALSLLCILVGMDAVYDLKRLPHFTRRPAYTVFKLSLKSLPEVMYLKSPRCNVHKLLLYLCFTLFSLSAAAAGCWLLLYVCVVFLRRVCELCFLAFENS